MSEVAIWLALLIGGAVIGLAGAYAGYRIGRYIEAGLD